MSYGVLIPTQIAAKDVDAWNRSAVCASARENGDIMVLGSKSATAGQSEVWTATEPATGTLVELWMAYEPEVVLTAGKYKGLDVDPRNFRVEATKVFSVYKPRIGDIINMTGECLLGSYSAGVTTHVNATDTTGGFKLYWANQQDASCLSYMLTGVSYISIGSGAIDSQRATMYQFTCVAV